VRSSLTDSLPKAAAPLPTMGGPITAEEEARIIEAEKGDAHEG
jgi:hypothetical protein